MIKILTVNDCGKIELTKAELENLLSESYQEGYNKGKDEAVPVKENPSFQEGVFIKPISSTEPRVVFDTDADIHSNTIEPKADSLPRTIYNPNLRPWAVKLTSEDIDNLLDSFFSDVKTLKKETPFSSLQKEVESL